LALAVLGLFLNVLPVMANDFQWETVLETGCGYKALMCSGTKPIVVESKKLLENTGTAAKMEDYIYRVRVITEDMKNCKVYVTAFARSLQWKIYNGITNNVINTWGSSDYGGLGTPVYFKVEMHCNSGGLFLKVQSKVKIMVQWKKKP
jgi:hypothetical protein